MIDEKVLIERLRFWLETSDNEEWSRLISLMISVVKYEIPKIDVSKWTPCSERIPSRKEWLKNDGRFVVTDTNRVYEGYFDIYDGTFKKDRFGCEFVEDKCMCAWMPLPEPYKEE